MFSKKKKEVKKTAEEIARETAQLGQWYEERKEEREVSVRESETRRAMEEEAAENVAKYQGMDLLDTSLLPSAQRIQALSSRMALSSQETPKDPKDLLSSLKDSHSISILDLDLDLGVGGGDAQHSSGAQEQETKTSRTHTQAAKTLGLVGDSSRIDDLDLAADLWDSPDSDPLFSSLSRPRPPRSQPSSSSTSSHKVDLDDLFGEEGRTETTTTVEVRKVAREHPHKDKDSKDKDSKDKDSKDKDSKDKDSKDKGPTVEVTGLLAGKEESSGDYFGSQSDILSSTDSSLSDLASYLSSNASFLSAPPSFNFDD